MKFRIILVFIIIVTQAKAQNLVRIWFDGVENNQLKVVTEVYLKSCNPPNHYEDIFLELEDLDNKKTYKFSTNFFITKNYITFCNKPTEYSFQCYGDGSTYHHKRWWSVNYIDLENLGCALNFSIQLNSVDIFTNTNQSWIYVSSWIDICNNPDFLIANYDTVSILNSNFSATESVIVVEIPDIETRNKSFFNVLNVYPKKFDRNLEVSTEICPPKLNKYDSFEYPIGLNYLSPTYRITNTNHPRFTKAEKEDNSLSFIYHDSFYFPNPKDSLLFFNFSRYNDIITMAYKNTFFNDGKKLMEINTFNKLEAFDHNTSNFPYIEVNYTKEKNPWMAKDVLKGDSLILHNRNPTYNGDTIVLDYREKSKFIFVRSHFKEVERIEKDSIKLEVSTNLPYNYLNVSKDYRLNNGRIELNFDSSHVSPYPYYIVVRAENTTPHIPFGVTLDSSDFVTWAYIPVYITDTTRSDLQRPKPVEIKEYDAFEMFPNPAKQSCYFNYGLKIASVAIYSSTGSLINNININDKFYRLSTELLPDGIFFLHFTDELGSQWVRKLVVQK